MFFEYELALANFHRVTSMKQNRKTEDYMKVIYRLQENDLVRGVDIARELGVTKPTVSVALRELEAAGLITVCLSRSVKLTPEGERIARGVAARYEALYGLLTELGVDEASAREDACRMEHGLSDSSLLALTALRDYLRAEQPPVYQAKQ